MRDWKSGVLLLLHYLIYCGLWTSGRTSSSTGVLSNAPPDPLQPRSVARRGYLIRVGQSLNLTCPYDVPFYSWTPSDEPAKILSEKQIFRVRSATLEDSGRYSCHAVDGYGRNSAEVAVRVIDPSSYVAQRECVLEPSGSINPDGPCFLISYSDRDLNPKMAWGDSIVLDCDVVTGSGNVDGLIYQWEVQYSRSLTSASSASSSESSRQRLLARASVPQSIAVASSAVATGSSLTSSTGGASQSALSAAGSDLVRFSEPKLRIDKLNLRHNGEYRCTVIDSRRSVSGLGTSGRSDVISRTFRLSVKPRAEGPIIQGPRTSNETVVAGQDAVFKCEVNPEEHRSSTIRWGKSIDAAQRIAYETEGREVIQWAGGTFVVLPSVPNSAIPEEELSSMVAGAGALDEATQFMTNTADSAGVARRKVSRTTNGVIPASGAVATEASPSQTSRLVLRKVKSSDAGRYVCSVLTEAGRDDHKFVHISVIGSVGEAGEVTGNGVRRLTIYIAVPTAVFLVCLCVVTYCLVSRRAARSSRAGHRRARNFYGQAQQSHLKSPSAASSTSIGVCRNGVGATPGVWNGPTDPRLRPSPAATGPGTGTLGYSSTNGSNSMTGTGQVLVSTQGYQTAVPGSVAMVPGSYPLFMQSMSSQPPASYYAMQDPNGLGSAYTPNVYPVSSAGGNEYMLTGNQMNVLYPPGMIYPVANGHAPGQNSVLNSSSPDSSAITGPTDATEGRLLYHPSGQGSNPAFPTYQTGAVTTCGIGIAMGAPVGAGLSTGGGLAYHHHHHHHHQAPPSHLNSSLGDMDLGHSNTPLLSYHSHTDNTNTHNSLRA